jgi:hypothetical protein
MLLDHMKYPMLLTLVVVAADEKVKIVKVYLVHLFGVLVVVDA